MREKLSESVIPLIALSFSIYYFITVVEAPWEAKIYSYALIIGILACSSTIAIKIFRLKNASGKAVADTEKAESRDRKFFLMLTLGIAFVAAIYLIGYVPAAFLFVLVAPLLLGYRKGSILLTATVVVGLIYALFVGILKLNLPTGYLF